MAEPGEIVWASVHDKNGHRKDRPVVIVFKDGSTIFCCCISTKDLNPRPGSYLRMPWDARGTSKTGLTQACFAVADWIVDVREEDIRRRAGVLSNATFHKLLDLIAAYRA